MNPRHRYAAGLSAAALTAALAAPAAPGPASAACRPAARDLLITYQPVDHTVADAQYHLARLTIANGDDRCALGADGWAMYFNAVRRPAAVLDGAAGDTARAQLAGQGLAVARADAARSGDFYTLEPAAGFAPVAPGERREIDINFELWAVHKSDGPAGWTIRFGGGRPAWVPARNLLDPADPKQTTAFSGDHRPVETAATRYAANTSPKTDLTLRQSLVPQPLSAAESGGTVAVGGLSHVSAPRSLRGEAGYLRSALRDVARGRGAPVSLRVDPRLDVDDDGAPDPEGYTLTTTRHGVRIVGTDRAGVLYGIQTLRQLVPAADYEAAAGGHRPATVDVPRARIADAPLFGYRGLQLDVGRHFETKATVQKFLDLMSFTKLNRLHLGLTNDEGWRLEIPGLPELTGFGSRREFDLAETGALHQGMGSAGDLGPGDGITGKARGETEANLGVRPAHQGYEQSTANFVGKGGGFYSVRDFEEILRYAAERHIEVVPELNFPAHARAAVQSMERRYQRTHDATYRLLDPGDTSRHVSVQYYDDNLANPCLSSTYAFLDKVVSEVSKMYRSAGVPLNRINLGGDEPPGPPEGWWSGSPACASDPATAGKSGEELKELFFTRWNGIAHKYAPHTAGWEDITDPTRAFRLKGFSPLPWQNVWGWGREDWAYRFANEGTPVILAHATNLYMDLAYNKDPDEPGYYWAAYVDEKSTFAYQPFNVYANATEDRWGNPVTPNPSWTKLTPEGRENILGLEAQLWGENGKTPEIREYQAFPKLLGAAERAWNRDTPAPAEMEAAWNVFTNTLGQKTFPLLSFYQPVGLDGTGVNYRVPPPGAKVSGGTLAANVRDPGMAVEYSTDGVRWRPYTGPVRVGEYALTRTRSADGRTSRISQAGVPGWRSGASYEPGALVTHRGELFRATRPGTGGEPGLPRGGWTLLR
ncbi:carbohydate-binding domain-containing protein [Actinomadura sp. NAK00032]|uniref:family 20 glycosylhydrolase n=1 Tax=Actinomadura sp. NAK00032 TaxID=2742128 RepID=UPI0015902D97|nr:family 20 glycosylhydrolase [Actinomadura sp. NAK00032]QKW36035.1 carbohydate-binding domain-containing protein [Actinomadura sp. NAK00032]